MQPANKIQNKIRLTRSCSVQLVFALLLNSFSATVDRRGTWFCAHAERRRSSAMWAAIGKLVLVAGGAGASRRERRGQREGGMSHSVPQRSGIRHGGNQPSAAGSQEQRSSL